MYSQLQGDLDGRPVNLTEVCEQPMAPQYEHCLIQSVMNYWQNDPLELNKSIELGDYTTKIVGCIRYVHTVKNTYLVSEKNLKRQNK